MGIASCGHQRVASGLAPRLHKPNHVLPRLRFGRSGLHVAFLSRGAGFHKIYFSTGIATVRIFP